STVPSSGINHIEIIISPYVKYDAEGSGGIINIISKSSSSEGKSMMVTLNGGYKNRINGGLGFSYNNGRLGVDLGYSGRYETEHIVSDLTREILAPYESIVQDAVSNRKNNIHSFNLALSYAATSKNLIGLNIKGLFPLLKTYQSITGSNPPSSVPAYRRLNDITFSRKNLEAAASFKHIFEKGVDELSFGAAFSGIKGSRPANYYIEDEFVQRSEGGGRPTSASVQADWLKVTRKGLKIESGAKFQSRWNNFEYRFYDRASGTGTWVLNNEFSNDLRHKENVYAAYISVSGMFAERLQYSYGARGEYFTSDFDQLSTGENIYDERFSLFPFLSLKLGLGAENTLSAIYNRRVTRPTYPQLNPYINQIDHITYESGNKWVRPELTDKAELSLSFKKGKISLNTGFYLSHTKDHIAQVTNVISANGSTSGNKLLITYVNVPHYYKPGIYIDCQLNSNGKISISPSVSVYYNKFIDNAPDPAELRENNLTLDASGFTATGSLRFNYYPDKKTDLQLFYSYISGQSLPRFNVDEYHTADVALKRRFLKGKITGTLSVSDIFNSKKWNISSNNEIYRLTNNSKSDSRIVWLGMTLNLNSFKIKQPKGEPQTSEEGLIKLGY
ncbi:MAG: outer membrane beta-barrel family protein, partial [Bacteroidales bacterium]|nr:outer membrane beta-barrel family protein [Bacteroidales bacterium]